MLMSPHNEDFVFLGKHNLDLLGPLNSKSDHTFYVPSCFTIYPFMVKLMSEKTTKSNANLTTVFDYTLKGQHLCKVILKHARPL